MVILSVDGDERELGTVAEVLSAAGDQPDLNMQREIAVAIAAIVEGIYWDVTGDSTDITISVR
jgi:hypothetical protein